MTGKKLFRMWILYQENDTSSEKWIETEEINLGSILNPNKKVKMFRIEPADMGEDPIVKLFRGG